MMTRWVWLAGLWLAAAAPPGVAPCVTAEGAGTSIDWTAGWITVTGRALLGDGTSAEAFARRAAQLDGYRNLSEALGGVAVTVNETLSETAASDTAVKTRLEGYVQGARVMAQRVEAGPPTELVLTMMAPLRGQRGLYQVVADRFDYQTAAPAPPPATDWTGLVLDARRPAGHDGEWPLLRPALFPTVTDRGGRLLYGPSHVPDDIRVQGGIVLYVDVAAEADQEALSAEQVPLGALAERVGERPLYLPATPVAGGDCTVYLSDDDRAKFAQLDSQTVLGRGRVLVLRRTVVKAAADQG